MKRLLCDQILCEPLITIRQAFHVIALQSWGKKEGFKSQKSHLPNFKKSMWRHEKLNGPWRLNRRRAYSMLWESGKLVWNE